MSLYDLKQFPDYFRKYKWDAKHSLYGYPPDEFSEFNWIASLEYRFDWLKNNYANKTTSSIYLLKEMIQWGGSQNGVLQKFEDGLQNCNLFQLMENTISNLSDAEKAIESALKFPGIGLTYASKLLRFLDPIKYGAIDSRIRSFLQEEIGGISDSNSNSMINGYVHFIEILTGIQNDLNIGGIIRPKCDLCIGLKSEFREKWRLADIEMALFFCASAHKTKNPAIS
jgi:hypothetical protein